MEDGAEFLEWVARNVLACMRDTNCSYPAAVRSVFCWCCEMEEGFMVPVGQRSQVWRSEENKIAFFYRGQRGKEVS